MVVGWGWRGERGEGVNCVGVESADDGFTFHLFLFFLSRCRVAAYGVQLLWMTHNYI